MTIFINKTFKHNPCFHKIDVQYINLLHKDNGIYFFNSHVFENRLKIFISFF